MVKLQADMCAKGLQIVCFPCNQFKSQEPRPCAEIKAFVQSKSDQNCGGLLLMDKICVNDTPKEQAHPLYNWMKGCTDLPLENNNDIKWNFGAYFLFGKDGKLAKTLTGVPKKMREDVEEVLGGSAARASGSGSPKKAASKTAATGMKKSAADSAKKKTSTTTGMKASAVKASRAAMKSVKKQ